eukprot:7378470-Prymnesium_polylepis.1
MESLDLSSLVEAHAGESVPGTTGGILIQGARLWSRTTVPNAALASVLCQGEGPGPSDTARTRPWPEPPVGSEPAGRCAQSLLL